MKWCPDCQMDLDCFFFECSFCGETFCEDCILDHEDLCIENPRNANE